MKSLDELHRIREKAQQDLRIRDSKQRAKVIVAMGTCGIAAGAKSVLNAILDELDKRGIKDVLVVQAGCKGLCSQEPLVDVFRAGEPGVTYGYVTPERARTIVSQHLVNGNIVGEWVVTTTEA
ncbi:MAG: (2Fe-2S) ferredoxin domain-containing protein [Armatimonadetes bacterium]|nr:(2Fe-2S) ferredoxin domain-containing protein [Armatimonadota bacterium]